MIKVWKWFFGTSHAEFKFGYPLLAFGVGMVGFFFHPVIGPVVVGIVFFIVLPIITFRRRMTN